MDDKDFKYWILIQIVLIIIGIVLWSLSIAIKTLYIENSIVQTIFKIITFLGNELAFIVLIAVIYIIYDKRYAKNLTLVLLATTYINGFLKDTFQDPRPAVGTEYEESYGFPSGHSQGSSSFYGYIGYEFREKVKPNLVPMILSAIILLVVFSRVILAVHDFEDIGAGLIFGVAIMWAFIYLEPIATEKINSLQPRTVIIIGIIVSLAIFLIGTLIFPTPGAKLEEGAIPFTDSGTYAQIGGILLGLSIGYILENIYINYEPSKLEIKYKIINLVIGLIILFVGYFGLELLKGVFDSVIYRYIRYALIAFILVFIVPWIFTKINPPTE